MTITVVGSGYVGLTAAACFADVGKTVICVDTDAARIESLNRGHIPIFEPGLDALVQRGREAGRLRFTHGYDDGSALQSTIFFIAVGTPPGEDGAADVSHVLSAARSIGDRIVEPAIIVIKSTVPVGTAAKVEAVVAEALRRRGAAVRFAVVSNPEFLKEGAAIHDFMRPDRIIIGSDDPWAIDIMRHLYASRNRNHDKIIVMDANSAELTKYAANAMLATRISFMNELAALAEAVDADIEAVRRGIGADPRIGSHFLYPGCGYGGSCFPKDMQALIRTAANHDVRLGVIQAAEEANDRQKQVLFRKISSFYGGAVALRGKTIAVWGLAFKPNTDDMREASSRVLITELLEAGCHVRAYDPVALSEAKRIFANAPGLTFCDTANQALDDSDALAIVTEWREFRSPDFELIARKLKDRAIFDGRNMYERADMGAFGLRYFDIGRGGNA